MGRFSVEVTERSDRRRAASEALSCTIIDSQAQEPQRATACTITSELTACTITSEATSCTISSEATSCTISNEAPTSCAPGTVAAAPTSCAPPTVAEAPTSCAPVTVADAQPMSCTIISCLDSPTAEVALAGELSPLAG